MYSSPRFPNLVGLPEAEDKSHDALIQPIHIDGLKLIELGSAPSLKCRLNPQARNLDEHGISTRLCSKHALEIVPSADLSLSVKRIRFE